MGTIIAKVRFDIYAPPNKPIAVSYTHLRAHET